MTHELKIWPRYFRAIVSGEKTFEIRRNDRGYAVGDVLILREWDTEKKSYTGDFTTIEVTYILELGDFFGHGGRGFVVMSIKPTEATS